MMNKKILILSSAVALCAACSSGVKDYNADEKRSSKQFDSEVEGSSKVTRPKSSGASEVHEKEEPKISNGDLEDKFENAVNSQREAEMISSGSELLARNPENVKVLNGFGIFYLKNNEPGAAKIYFDRVLAKDAQNADANNGLGVVAMKENKEAEAQAFFKKALLGDNDHAGANANLGAYYLKYLDYEKALTLLKTAYSEDKSNPTIANNYAIALRGTGDIDKALSIYEGIDKKSQKVPVLLNQAILWAEFKKDSKQAKEILNKIRFISTDPVILKKVNALTQKLDQEVAK